MAKKDKDDQPMDETTEPSATEPSGETKEEPTGKKGAEDKLDDFADRVSKTISDGVKRVEDAFERSKHSFREHSSISGGRWKGWISSPSGGAVLILVGFIWFFYAIGLLDQPIFPILLIILGFYFLLRKQP
jgi:hypothetical protein